MRPLVDPNRRVDQSEIQNVVLRRRKPRIERQALWTYVYESRLVFRGAKCLSCRQM